MKRPSLCASRRPVILLVQRSRDDSRAPDHSSLRSVALNRPANVTEYNIARRAYELYLARDGEDGHDVDDWLQAERELQGEEYL